jgi:NAD-dependent dihydropyrimidine dehydrogenase PreA subunit
MRMRYIRNGETLALDRDACKGCGRCIEVCPHEVLAMAGKRAQIIDREACMECGACSNNCETGAIKVRAGVGCASAVIQGMIQGTSPQWLRRPGRSRRSRPWRQT